MFFQSASCLLCISVIASCVEIKDMRVPRMIESGSEPHVILDCDYDLRETEGTQVDVKWFFRDDPQPFFQWLPGRPPQTIGDLFRDRLDLTYEVEGSDEFRKHRAIKILHPTTELSGMYRCKVSSFVDEDFMQKPMIVYSPPRDIEIFYTKPDSRTLNLTCLARGVFPKPHLELSWGKRFDRSETTTMTLERNGLFDVSVHKILMESDLQPETIFECLLTIPGTSFSAKADSMYLKGQVLYQVRASSAPPSSKKLIATAASSSILLLLLLALMPT